jgi:cyclopropane fatty-acyl-phospholipid synthase-like methyltransferase
MLDEMSQAGVDYADPAEVATFEDRMERRSAARSDEFAAIVERLGLDGTQTVIDLGAGVGQFAVAAAPRSRKVHAVDVSRAMLDRARVRAAEAGADNIEFHHGGFLTYEHAHKPADAIVSHTALHHLPDAWKQVALIRLHDMLAPDGLLFLRDTVFTFRPREYAGAFDGFVRGVAELFGDEEMARQGERHVAEEYTAFDWIMEGLLRRAGFAIATATYRGQWATYVCRKEPT